MTRPTYERVAALLIYEPNTGAFRWRQHPSPLARVKSGQQAGSIEAQGYRVIGIGRRQYKASRLAFLLMTGHWPQSEMDHANRIKTDNRWSNLRIASHSENQINKVSHRPAELRGASFSKRRRGWAAQIQKDGKNRHLGYFQTAAEAHAAYGNAATRLFGEFAFKE